MAAFGRRVLLAAYPAEYGNLGVMIFIINQDSVLLQKDLGRPPQKTQPQ
jgi:hypothetical protein